MNNERLLQLIMYVDHGVHWTMIDVNEEKLPTGGLLSVEYQGRSTSEVLHAILDARDDRFYLSFGGVNNKRVRREEKYPYYVSIAPLCGYVPEVCDIENEKPFKDLGERWRLSYPLELWVRENDVIRKVEYFSGWVQKELLEYMQREGLEFDEGPEGAQA